MVPEQANQAQAAEARRRAHVIPWVFRLQVIVPATSGGHVPRHPDGRLQFRLHPSGPPVVTSGPRDPCSVARGRGLRLSPGILHPLTDCHPERQSFVLRRLRGRRRLQVVAKCVAVAHSLWTSWTYVVNARSQSVLLNDVIA